MTVVMKILSSESVRARFPSSASEADRKSILADLARSEIEAQVVGTRRAIGRRVATLAAPVLAPEADEIRVIIDELVRAGDVTSGPGGQLAATPLRLVPLGQGLFKIFGSTPTTRLARRLPALETDSGVRRRSSLGEGDLAVLREQVSQAGGSIVEAERWSGIETSPSAGSSWLKEVDARLGKAQAPAGSLEEGVTKGWRVYWPESGGETQADRWKHEVGNKQLGRLWRAWDDRGWYVHAWTAGGAPNYEAALRLNRSDALRTAFSLDLEAETPLSFRESKTEGLATVGVRAFLPGPEYRYLSTLATRTEKDDGSVFFLFEETWERAKPVLEKRLGVRFETGGPEG